MPAGVYSLNIQNLNQQEKHSLRSHHGNATNRTQVKNNNKKKEKSERRKCLQGCIA